MVGMDTDLLEDEREVEEQQAYTRELCSDAMQCLNEEWGDKDALEPEDWTR